MKIYQLGASLLIAIILFPCGCARSVLRSAPLPSAYDAEDTKVKMVYCLPKGMIHFQRKPTTNEVTVETLYVPDPEKYYTLKYLTNRAYEENIDITLSEDMLLKKIDITSRPKIGEIVMKLF